MRIFVNYKQKTQPDHDFAREVEDRLRREGHQVFRDESNIAPTEEWPARLENEVRACDTMLSLVSNASLKSKWVLNEIDLALRLKKRMLPILLEEINESLRFQALNPRFMSIQWLTATGDPNSDCEAIIEALREVRVECYRDLVTKKLEQHGVNDGREVLEALFGVLYQGHWPAILTRRPTINDPQPRMNGEVAHSLAESLRNHVESWASLQDHNSHNDRQHGDEDRARRLSWQVQRLRCAADILNTLIAGWTRNSMARRVSMGESRDSPLFLFDDSDGEQAFVSPNAPSIQGGRRDKPVPPGHIVQMVRFGNQSTGGHPPSQRTDPPPPGGPELRR